MEPEQRNTAPVILPTLQLLSDTFHACGWAHTACFPEDWVVLRGCLVYTGQTDLQEDTLYILPEGIDFPIDDYCYVTSSVLSGSAPHLCGISRSLPEIINAVYAVFHRCGDFELTLRGILAGNGSLTDLCTAGSQFFRNPMYIHDDMFTVMAMSPQAREHMNLEFNALTGHLNLPLALINDFKLDPNYQQTLTLHEAAVWGAEESTRGIPSLFVNLWDGNLYLGRLLISQRLHPLPRGYSKVAEQFAAYIVQLLRRDGRNQSHIHQDFEAVLRSLKEGATPDPQGLRSMLSILGWNASDRYLCMQLRDQDANAAIRPDRALSSELLSVLDGFSYFHHEKSLCIVINLNVSRWDIHQIRLRLAPYIRDSLMYGGISNPMEGILSISRGFRQTALALDFIAQHSGSQWLLPFSACALPYFYNCITREMTAAELADPALLTLRKYDAENNTAFYRTLRTYLIYERSIPRTAEALIIHRTTLTYRLKKIDELVHLNLDDDEQRQYILFSIFLLDHQSET